MPAEDVEDSIARTFVTYAVQRMRRSLSELERCVQQLSEAQMQVRGGEHENSVVNLLLHMEGNLRQWVLHGVGEQPDVRTRDAEFALDAPQHGSDAMARLRSAIEESCAVIEATTAERLMQVTDPQPTGIYRHCKVLEAIAKAFGHLEHHTGQVILLTKQRVGHDLDLSMPRKR